MKVVVVIMGPVVTNARTHAYVYESFMEALHNYYISHTPIIHLQLGLVKPLLSFALIEPYAIRAS